MRLLSLLLVAPLLGAAGAPTPNPIHLDYAFAAYPAAARGAPVSDFSGQGTGTIAVDVVGVAPDGGTVIQATQSWWRSIRPRQTRQCELYPHGTLRCDQLPYPSQAEEVLLPLLAHELLAPATAGAPWNGHFDLAYGGGMWTTGAALTFTPHASRAGTVDLSAHGTLRQAFGRQLTITDQADITYDPRAALPVLVHDVRGPLPTHSVYSRSAVDLKLLSD